MKTLTKKKMTNYLDYIPKHNSNYSWQENAKGNIEVKIRHEGVFNHIAQKYLHKPAATKLELEEFGSFIWLQINGENTIYDIGQLIKARYQKEAEPLYERLSVYMKQLEKLRLIEYVENKKE